VNSPFDVACPYFATLARSRSFDAMAFSLLMRNLKSLQY